MIQFHNTTLKSLAIAGAIVTLAACSPQAAETASTAPAETTAEATKADEAYEITVPSGAYVVDKTHAYINFSYSHLGFSRPTIAFREIDATLNFNAEDPAASSVNVTVDASSIDTGVPVFDEHIADIQFFDIPNNPTITFNSTSMSQTGPKTGTMTGDLMIKGTTLPVTFDVVLRQAANHPMAGVPAIGVSATTTVKRSDFDMGAYAPNVSDEVDIVIEAEFQLPEDE